MQNYTSTHTGTPFLHRQADILREGQDVQVTDSGEGRLAVNKLLGQLEKLVSIKEHITGV